VDHLDSCGAEPLDLRLAAAARGYGVSVQAAIVVPGAAGDLGGGLEVGGHEDLPAAVAHIADLLEKPCPTRVRTPLVAMLGPINNFLRMSSIHMPLLPASKMSLYARRSWVGSWARIVAEMVGCSESGAGLEGSDCWASSRGFEEGEGSSGGGGGLFRGGMAQVTRGWRRRRRAGEHNCKGRKRKEVFAPGLLLGFYVGFRFPLVMSKAFFLSCQKHF